MNKEETEFCTCTDDENGEVEIIQLEPPIARCCVCGKIIK